MSARKPLLPADAAAFVRGDAPASPAPQPPAPAAADGEARVRFTVDLPRSLHKRLKQAALDQEEPMTDLARRALGEWLDSRG
ncbi:hypothetical protein [Vulcanococcus limneticus]|uniref:hypothetical protein n=1 Tax=Vulcanococcus limneticus TaxID=2170428 RepID=UPI00398BCCC8